MARLQTNCKRASYSSSAATGGLIAELEPEAKATVEQLTRAKAELIAADAKWHQISQRVNELLPGVSGSTARTDAPSEHGLESTVHDLRRAPEVTSPLPHYHGHRAREADEETKKLVRLRRRGEQVEAA
jgi:hypothetical protein